MDFIFLHFFTFVVIICQHLYYNKLHNPHREISEIVSNYSKFRNEVNTALKLFSSKQSHNKVPPEGLCWQNKPLTSRCDFYAGH